MIIVRMFGGLGNQLFIYSYAFSLSKKLKKELFLDTISGFSKDFIYQRNDNLKYLGIQTKNPKKSLLFDNFLGRLTRKILRRFDFPAKLFGVYYITDKNLHEIKVERLAKAKYVFLDGYFNSYHLFHEYKNDIFRSLNLDSNLAVKDCSKVNMFNLNSTIKIAIHYRSYKDVPIKDRSDNLVVNEEYYSKAINLFLKKYLNPTFFIFSDDINEAQKVIKTKNMIFVENKDDVNYPSQIKDFIMLLKCDHFIIANSTFSWWAAYLSNNKNKIVVRPSKQFYTQNKSFYPSEWVEI